MTVELAPYVPVRQIVQALVTASQSPPLASGGSVPDNVEDLLPYVAIFPLPGQPRTEKWQVTRAVDLELYWTRIGATAVADGEAACERLAAFIEGSPHRVVIGGRTVIVDSTTVSSWESHPWNDNVRRFICQATVTNRR